MLVLSRRPGERIVLPESGIEVTILSVQGGRVRLGITAPADVAVYREELWTGIRSREKTSEVSKTSEV